MSNGPRVLSSDSEKSFLGGKLLETWLKFSIVPVFHPLISTVRERKGKKKGIRSGMVSLLFVRVFFLFFSFSNWLGGGIQKRWVSTGSCDCVFLWRFFPYRLYLNSSAIWLSERADIVTIT